MTNSTASSISEMSFPLLGESSSEPPIEEKKEIGILTAILILTCTITGSGPLAMGYCFRTGIYLNIILSIILGILSTISFIFLIYSSDATGVYDYPSLIIPSLGKKWIFLPNAMIAISLFGVTILYLQYVASLATAFFMNFSNIPDWITNRWFLIFRTCFGCHPPVFDISKFIFSFCCFLFFFITDVGFYCSLHLLFLPISRKSWF